MIEETQSSELKGNKQNNDQSSKAISEIVTLAWYSVDQQQQFLPSNRAAAVAA